MYKVFSTNERRTRETRIPTKDNRNRRRNTDRRIAREIMTGILSSKIKEYYEKDIDMIQALIYADSKQVGKSSYALQTAYEVYQDWDTVFKHLFFRPEKLVRYAQKLAQKNQKVPIIIWDDAGVHGGSDLYHNNRKLYYDLDQALQTIGVVCQSLLATATDVAKPTGLLTDDRNVTIKITKKDQYERKAKLFINSTLPWGKKIDSKEAVDSFRVMLPNEVYERYRKQRLKLSKDAFNTFLDNAEETKEEKEEPTKMELPE